MASTSTSRSAPGTHKRDTSTVVMVGGVPVKRAARTSLKRATTGRSDKRT